MIIVMKSGIPEGETARLTEEFRNWGLTPEKSVLATTYTSWDETGAMIDFCGIPIEPEEIVDFLKREMLLKEVCEKIVSQKIIEKAATETGITVTPEEIQTEADSIRYRKRLEKASDTLAWLVDQMMNADEWTEELAIANGVLSGSFIPWKSLRINRGVWGSPE